ncbi:unspecific monooxygenase [Necator americanus]|uniref:Unspecific monooxygenase n=1 Tax=Necator americanus TaxID=51031 RepID=W2SHT5_NECAM|nr:unspecific monooxygenase [Necator americanus]ETN69133.1 unspecific monooxygenase [Necator americanus]
MFLIIASFVLSVAIFYIWRFYENVKRYPKGPTPIPIFGNLFSTNFRKLHEQLTDFSKAYGNVFTVWIPKPTVVVTDYEGIKEAFAKKGDDFSGRTGIFPDTIFQNVENGGVIFSQDDNWKEQRRISLHILRDFGMGKNLMEEQVLLSAQEFIAHMASMKNKEAVDMRHPIQMSLEVSPLSCLPSFLQLRDSKITFFAQLFPVIYRLPIVGYYSCGRFQQSVDKLKISIREDVERCLKSYNVDEEPECFAQAYCQKMQSNPELNYDNLLNVCMDFFLAGMETTSTTLRWSTLFLANDTRVQFEPSKGRTIDLEPICAGVLLPKQQPLRVTQL